MSDEIDAVARRDGAPRSCGASSRRPRPRRQTERAGAHAALRRARASAALVAAAGVVAWGLVGCAGPHTSALVGAGATTSADRSPSAASMSPAAAPSTVPSPKTVAAASCTASQLAASIGRHGSAAGTENILIVLTNTSHHTCTLGGKVELAAVRADGVVDNPGFVSYTDPAYAPPSPVTGPGPVAPGAAGGFVIGEGLNCPPIKGTYTALRITIANGPTVEMPWSGLFAGCSPIVGPAGPVPASAAP